VTFALTPPGLPGAFQGAGITVHAPDTHAVTTGWHGPQATVGIGPHHVLARAASVSHADKLPERMASLGQPHGAQTSPEYTAAQSEACVQVWS
jgi:hypothetical protein